MNDFRWCEPWPLWLLASLGLLGTWARPGWAHGAKIQYQSTPAIQIQATYDDGRPMKEAQVVVYAPQDPATPWLKGTTDAEGRFTFVPDVSQAGNWDVKVRQAGHGDLVSIPIDGEAGAVADSGPQAGYTPLQKGTMAAVGVWGFVGTALFFSRKK